MLTGQTLVVCDSDPVFQLYVYGLVPLAPVAVILVQVPAEGHIGGPAAVAVIAQVFTITVPNSESFPHGALTTTLTGNIPGVEYTMPVGFCEVEAAGVPPVKVQL